MNNIEWIFSGIGVAAITVIWRVLVFVLKKKKDTKQEIQISIAQQTSQTVIEKSREEPHPIEELCKRVLEVFEQHDIPIQQIPSFVDKKFNFDYFDFYSIENLIKKLTPEFIKWISDTFGVEIDWLDGKSENKYKTVNIYKLPESFRNLLFEIMKKYQCYHSYRQKISVYAYKEPVELRGNDTPQNTFIQFLIRVEIGNINDTSIYRYYIIDNGMYWDYWKSRRDAKIAILYCEALGLFINGFDMSKENIRRLGSGLEFPSKLIKEHAWKSYTWYPEDYVQGRHGIHPNEINDYALAEINTDEIISNTRKEHEKVIKEWLYSSTVTSENAI
jgi:hypothetical protein